MAETIVGGAVLYGLPMEAGAENPVTGGVGGVFVIRESEWNVGNIDFTREFKLDEIPTQSGASIGTIIASQRRRKMVFDFVPTDDTRENCKDIIEDWIALEELSVLTIARFRVASVNGTWNYLGGLSVKMGRETYIACNITVQQVQKEDLTWGALPLVVG